MSATPIPPADLVAALSSLRAAFAEVHVMHECDGQCPPGCDLTDLSGSAYRDHDERNADVREVIHDRAEVLVTALSGGWPPALIRLCGSALMSRTSRMCAVGAWMGRCIALWVWQACYATCGAAVRLRAFWRG
ncbi:hypothetical protein FIV07_27640 (plasmid) [Mycobacterium sp. THAF192]|nr:hypothetical protein FIV07_27640 [Mycobacterium sp. THAF192]